MEIFPGGHSEDLANFHFGLKSVEIKYIYRKFYHLKSNDDKTNRRHEEAQIQFDDSIDNSLT